MTLELRHKKARLYSAYIDDAIKNAIEISYTGKLVISLNFNTGGITECEVQKKELITVDKLKPKALN